MGRSGASRGHPLSGALLSWPVVKSCGAVCKEGPRPGESHGHTHLAPGTRRSVLLCLWSARSSGPAHPSWGDRSGPRFPGPRAARAECACACANAAPSPVQWAHPLPCCPSHPRPRCCPHSGSRMPAPNAIVQGRPPRPPPCPALCRPPMPSPHSVPPCRPLMLTVPQSISPTPSSDAVPGTPRVASPGSRATILSRGFKNKEAPRRSWLGGSVLALEGRAAARLPSTAAWPGPARGRGGWRRAGKARGPTALRPPPAPTDTELAGRARAWRARFSDPRPERSHRFAAHSAPAGRHRFQRRGDATRAPASVAYVAVPGRPKPAKRVFAVGEFLAAHDLAALRGGRRAHLPQRRHRRFIRGQTSSRKMGSKEVGGRELTPIC